MKSEVDNVLHVAEGLLTDAILAYPALKESLTMDFHRLALNCQTRGLASVMLDLPNLDQLLLAGLERGRLLLTGPFSSWVSSKARVPKLFSGLWLRVFDKDAGLKPEPDVNAILFLRQFCCLGKKILHDCSEDRVKAAITNYVNIEAHMRPPTKQWRDTDVDFEEDWDLRHLCDVVPLPPSYISQPDLFGDHYDNSFEGTRRLLDSVQKVADIVAESLGDYCPIRTSTEWEQQGLGIGFKHGPGAVAEQLDRQEKSAFPNWPAKLDKTFPYELVGKPAGIHMDRPLNHERPSRLLCVPKTAKGPRLIAAEPTSHQWCQQGVRAFLEEQINQSFISKFINFRRQSLSGDLVLSASRDRSLATVDLSDASDRLSCFVVERMFRRNPSLLTALHAARTRHIAINNGSNTDFLFLKKFATQGTAVTFPIQSLVFLCIAIGACIDGEVSEQKIGRFRGQIRVFGDDIIIPRYGYVRLCRIMDALGLKVNVGKSYVNGHFRESCGVDGYGGYDVTPVKPKTFVANTPSACQAVIDTSNNLFNKGFWNAADRLRSLLPGHIQRSTRVVRKDGIGASGFSSFVGGDERHLLCRWNSRLHRNEVRVWGISLHTQQRIRSGNHVLLDFFSNRHSFARARSVSEYREIRRTRGGFSWEPRNTEAVA